MKTKRELKAEYKKKRVRDYQQRIFEHLATPRRRRQGMIQTSLEDSHE